MRARSLIQVLSFAVIVTVGADWMKSRATAVDLQTRLSAITTVRRQSAHALEQERDRLRVALAEANRRRLVDATATTFAPVPPPPPPRADASSLALGERRSPREWRNEGQATAQGTVATLLWAATGGDVAAMMPLIAYDEAGRTQARALYDTLPPSARQTFPTPESLVAGLTIQAMANSAVQLSWFHQRDADHATAGLLLSVPDQTAPKEIHLMPDQDNNPPILVDPYSNQFAVLSLQRSSIGWRIAIPAAAIKRLARQLTPPAR